MKRFIIAASAALVALTAIPAANAQNIRDRQYNQQQRIERGYARGDITPREYHRLQRQQASIQRDKVRARNSGYGMNRYERQRIAERQARASQNIYRQRHDRQRDF